MSTPDKINDLIFRFEKLPKTVHRRKYLDWIGDAVELLDAVKREHEGLHASLRNASTTVEGLQAEISKLTEERNDAQQDASWAPERAWNQLVKAGIEFYEVDENTDVKDADDELVDKLCNTLRKIKYCFNPGDHSVGIPSSEWWVVEDTALLDALVKLAQVGIDPDNLTLWVVGQYRAETDAGNVWDIQGVFSTREKALAACRGPNYFIGPIKLNEELPDETVEWPGREWPPLKDADGKAVTK